MGGLWRMLEWGRDRPPQAIGSPVPVKRIAGDGRRRAIGPIPADRRRRAGAHGPAGGMPTPIRITTKCLALGRVRMDFRAWAL